MAYQLAHVATPHANPGRHGCYVTLIVTPDLGTEEVECVGEIIHVPVVEALGLAVGRRLAGSPAGHRVLQLRRAIESPEREVLPGVYMLRVHKLTPVWSNSHDRQTTTEIKAAEHPLNVSRYVLPD